MARCERGVVGGVPRTHADSGRRGCQFAAVSTCAVRRDWIRRGWPVEFGRFRAVLPVRVARFAAPSGDPHRLLDSRFPSRLQIEVLAPAVLRLADPALSRDLFPRVLSGEDIWCQGFSEPESGRRSRVAPNRRCRHGGWLRHLGAEKYGLASLSSPTAAFCFCAEPVAGVRTSWHHHVSDRHGASGVKCVPCGRRPARNEYCEIFLDGVHVPDHRVIGEVDGGWQVAMYVLGCERGVIGSQRAAWLRTGSTIYFAMRGMTSTPALPSGVRVAVPGSGSERATPFDGWPMGSARCRQFIDKLLCRQPAGS